MGVRSVHVTLADERLCLPQQSLLRAKALVGVITAGQICPQLLFSIRAGSLMTWYSGSGETFWRVGVSRTRYSDRRYLAIYYRPWKLPRSGTPARTYRS